jgi:L-lactate dehydrogenase complex protein LldF
MKTALDERIETALQDSRLQAALEHLAFRFMTARNQAAADLPNWEELRTQAHAIKRHTIENLSIYLQQLEARVRERGGTVFWAEDAAQACSYVVELARARGVKLAVKSKSMVTEEIELNHALGRAGIQAVETDLGEYIIQLAGEKPSHIVAPAVHKTRAQIADLFEKKLGLPHTEDVAKLTATARAVLRQKFLAAGMGITGANFAIAESGSIVLMENEGNIRFSTSAPKIHVAVVGIEKVIPRMADLAVFLPLLARSATGQKLGSYLSILSGARRPGEPDGPEEFHLVLLDNGRTRMLADPVAQPEGYATAAAGIVLSTGIAQPEGYATAAAGIVLSTGIAQPEGYATLRRQTLYCIRCGACLNVCPVYRKIGGHAYPWVYSGPIGAILTPQMLGFPMAPKLPFASSLCGTCRDVCPVKIPIPEMLLLLRSLETESMPGGRWLERTGFRLWAWAMRQPWLYRLGSRVVPFIPARLLAAAGPLAGWRKTRELPVFPEESFRDWWRGRRAPPAGMATGRRP